MFTDFQDFFGNLSFFVSAEQVLNEPEVERLGTLLKHSAESQDVLRKSLTCRITGDPADFPIPVGDQYFAADLIPTKCYRHFVDCGAFTGDTLQIWLSRYSNFLDRATASYFAFEPERDNYSQLISRWANLAAAWQKRVKTYPFAVGAESGRAHLCADGPSSRVSGGESDMEVDVVRLDDVLANYRVSAIKMDLEGFEPQALLGARNLIQTQRPVLLIAIYHRVEHLWQIPLWIHDLSLDYRLHLRHHDSTCTETVCYAVPKELVFT